MGRICFQTACSRAGRGGRGHPWAPSRAGMRDEGLLGPAPPPQFSGLGGGRSVRCCVAGLDPSRGCARSGARVQRRVVACLWARRAAPALQPAASRTGLRRGGYWPGTPLAVSACVGTSVACRMACVWVACSAQLFSAHACLVRNKFLTTALPSPQLPALAGHYAYKSQKAGKTCQALYSPCMHFHQRTK